MMSTVWWSDFTRLQPAKQTHFMIPLEGNRLLQLAIRSESFISFPCLR